MIISIEGNIGAGKSTLVEILSNILTSLKLPCSFLQEPVSKWLELKNESGENLLDVFYNNKLRWAYSFQMNAFITRTKLLEKTIKEHGSDHIIFTERTVQADRNCFAKELKESGFINKLEWELYNEWYDWLVGKTDLDAVIYLQALPETCLKRIKHRDRSEESCIPIEYLTSIHQNHENWINELSKNKPVLILNVNPDFENDEKNKQQLVSTITKFIKALIKE